MESLLGNSLVSQQLPPVAGTVEVHGVVVRRLLHLPLASTTDSDVRLYRKSHNTASLLCYQGHILMENRTGLVVSAVVSHADGTRERTAARAMLDTVPGRHPKTVGADKAYDTADFITACRARHVTPHVAQNAGLRGGSAIY